jgi:tetratricopeptide (TPR) repeat protein
MTGHRCSRLLPLWVWLAGPALAVTATILAQPIKPLSLSANAAMAQESSPSRESTLSALSPETQGDLLMAHGSYAAALQAYQHGPLRSAVIWNKMGIAYHHLFALEQARKDYQMALTLDPHYAEALNNLAAVYHGEGNYRQAERTYKKALKYAPNSAVTYGNLGTAYLSDQKFKQGAEAYQKALKLDPSVFDSSPAQVIDDGGSRGQRAAVNYYLAKTFAAAGNNQQALICLHKALDAGFNDRRHLLEDKEFEQLRSTPEFQQLIVQLQELRGAHHASG